MIKLTKLNGVQMLVNTEQIQYIESIPESKIVMMNGEYLLAKESMDEIVRMVADFKKKCFSPDPDIIREGLLAAMGQISK